MQNLQTISNSDIIGMVGKQWLSDGTTPNDS